MSNNRKLAHGGARKGAGRPKTKEDTVVMRVPKSLVPAVKKLIKKKLTSPPPEPKE